MNKSRSEENDDKSRRKERELRRTSSRVILRRSFTARVLVPYVWLLSLFLAFSLFTTFTYVPDVPEHLHIHKNHKNNNNHVPVISAMEKPIGAAMEPLSLSCQRDVQEYDPILSSSSHFGEPDLAALHLPLGATTIILDNVPLNHPMQKNPIVTVLKEARITEISIDDWIQLPGLARNLTDLYGSRIVSDVHRLSLPNGEDPDESTGPIIQGMETCEEYRRNVPSRERYIGAAGMFNTGTNALENHLRTNVVNVSSVWQVPWGKNRRDVVHNRNAPPVVLT